MRRLLPLLLSVLLLAGCASPAAPEEEGAKRYEATFLTLFDTVTTVVGYAESEEDFQATAQSLHDALLEYHQLYDIYSDYDGVVNLKAVNDAAGGAPVVVDRKIIDLLLFCRDLCEGTGGQVNAALGGVLALWHDAREAGISDPASAALPTPPLWRRPLATPTSLLSSLMRPPPPCRSPTPPSGWTLGPLPRAMPWSRYAAPRRMGCFSAWGATSGPPAQSLEARTG